MRTVTLLLIFLLAPPAEAQSRTVVLLHGLARTSNSMNKMERALEKAGYQTCNVAYPSRKHDIPTLAEDFVVPAIEACAPEGPVDFVTHSMGGILVRYLAAHDMGPRIGRVVMLSPPNGGSEVVDKLGDLWLFEAINGPAGGELGTATEDWPRRLGPATFEVGVITGSCSINPILSALIPGRDDGKVAIAQARLDGMRDFLVLPTSHPFIMRNKHAIAQTLAFLQQGAFDADDAKCVSQEW